jgi:hypothetical protein
MICYSTHSSAMSESQETRLVKLLTKEQESIMICYSTCSSATSESQETRLVKLLTSLHSNGDVTKNNQDRMYKTCEIPRLLITRHSK